MKYCIEVLGDTLYLIPDDDEAKDKHLADCKLKSEIAFEITGLGYKTPLSIKGEK